MKNKYLPYVVGLICAIMFFLSHVVNTLQEAINNETVFSSVVMGAMCILLALLAFLPLLMEHMLYDQRKVQDGSTTLYSITKVLMCMSALLALLSFILNWEEFGTSNFLLFMGELGRMFMLGGLALLLFAVKGENSLFVKITGLVTLVGGVVTVVFLHGVPIVYLVQEISANLNTEIPEILFLYAFAKAVYFLCLLLTDGVSIYLAARALQGHKGPKRLLEKL